MRSFQEKISLGESGLLYTLPAISKDKQEILFSDLPKADQYWRRQKDFPQIFFDYNWHTKLNQETTRRGKNDKLLSLSHEDTALLLTCQDREMHRRTFGVWFMNKGIPEYLTGGHYFFLQWGAMPDVSNEDGEPYGGFRIFQRDVHYFLDLCKKDKECLGGYIVKPKKTGITNLIAIDYVEESTRYAEKIFGMMSKVLRPDCIETNMMYYFYCYDKLPMILKPFYDGRTQGQLDIRKPEKRYTGTEFSAREIDNEDKGLMNRVFCSATKANGFDGPKVFRAWYDEPPKYPQPNGPKAIFSKGSEVVKEQRQINGKVWWSSYNPETDDDSFNEAAEIFWDSQQSTIDPITKRTKTELYTHFISILGSEQGTFDKYGYSDIESTERGVDARREQLKSDPFALQAYIRQYPKTAEEAWRSGGSGASVFNNIRFGYQLKVVNYERRGNRHFIEFNYRWRKDPERLGLVDLVRITDEEILDNIHGKFRMYNYEVLEYQWFWDKYINVPVRNNLMDRKGRLRPAEDFISVSACDPTDFVTDTDVISKSNNAISSMLLPDIGLNTAFGCKVTDRDMVELLYRHEDPDDFYEDLVMHTLFWGGPILVEGNKKWVITKMKKDLLHNFLIMKTRDKRLEMYRDDMAMFYPDTVKSGQSDVIADIIRTIKNFYKTPVTDADYDNLADCKSERFLKQAMGFKKENTTSSDLVMCNGLRLMVRDVILAVKQMPKRKHDGNAEALRNVLNKLGDG